MITVEVRVIEREPEDDGPKFVWGRQQVIIRTTDADPTDEVTYIALYLARQAMREWRLKNAHDANPL
jgi:hypothetical protein